MKRRAFTLIELLVVVSILVLLIALMLPVISAAKISASRDKCGANMASLTIALQSYFIDSNGLKPCFYYTNGGGSAYRNADTFWPVLLAPYLNIPNTNNRPLSIDNKGHYYAFAQQIYSGAAYRSALFCPNSTDYQYPQTHPVDFSIAPDFSGSSNESNYRNIVCSSYGTVAYNWVGGSPSFGDQIQRISCDNIYWGSSWGPFNGPNLSNNFAPYVGGSNNHNFAIFGKNLYNKPPNTPVFAHELGNANPSNNTNYGCLQSVNGYFWNGPNIGFNLPNSPTTKELSHNNVLPFGYLDGHVEAITADTLKLDYIAGGGVVAGPINSTGPTPQGSAFTAKYGVNGTEPLYTKACGGNNWPENSNVDFIPWLDANGNWRDTH